MGEIKLRSAGERKNFWAKYNERDKHGRNGIGVPENLKTPSMWKNLRRVCLDSENSFERYGEKVDTKHGPYFFKDNGSKVLAVAHLDTVQDERHFGIAKSDNNIIWNCQLDDRLGAWMILHLLPEMGINMDVLLTTGEESCMSTAQFFSAQKDYNWLVEFDRSGTDVVTYQYRESDWKKELSIYRNINHGSYSDISELGHLGVCGANWGVGYYSHHWHTSRFRISEMWQTANLFELFYKNNKEKKFKHTPCVSAYSDWRGTYYGRWRAETDAYHGSTNASVSEPSLDCWEDEHRDAYRDQLGYPAVNSYYDSDGYQWIYEGGGRWKQHDSRPGWTAVNGVWVEDNEDKELLKLEYVEETGTAKEPGEFYAYDDAGEEYKVSFCDDELSKDERVEVAESLRCPESPTPDEWEKVLKEEEERSRKTDKFAKGRLF